MTWKVGFAFSNRNSLLLAPYSVHSLSVWTPKGHECFSENEFFRALLFLAIPFTNLTLFSSSPFKWEMFVTVLSLSKGARFSAAHGTFPNADHTLKHNTSLGRYEKFEIPFCVLPHHYELLLYQQQQKVCKFMETE